MERKIDLSISLVSYNSKSLLENCLKSIYKNIGDVKFEILLVDDGSSDGTAQMIKKKFKGVKLIKNSKNALYYTKAFNKNLKRATGRYFLGLNVDTEVHSKTLKYITTFMDAHPSVGLASCRQVDKNGETDTTCSRFPHPLIEFFESSLIAKMLRSFRILKVEQALATFRYKGWNRRDIKEVDVLPGSFLMGRVELFKKVGFLDENFLIFYGEPDYCKRAKDKGFLSYHFGNVSITHLRSQTLTKMPTFQRYKISEHDMLAYYKKYFGYVWWLFLWLALRPNWLYWKLASFKNNEV